MKKTSESVSLNNADLQKIVDTLIERIVAEVAPLQIYLFGSAAGDDARDVNDIDLLVVMPEGTHRRFTAQSLYRKLTGIGFPFDLLVATPGDLEKHRDNIGLIYHAALRDGKVVYAA